MSFGVLFTHRFNAVRTNKTDDTLAGGVLVALDSVEAHLQHGPTCGPVAQLNAGLLLRHESPSVSSVVDYNKSMDWTVQGECLSAEWMASSCRHFYPSLEVSVLEFPSVDELVDNLRLKDTVFLVPYDSDKDHSPCNRRGLSAHWATLMGFYVKDTSSETIMDVISDTSTILPEHVYLIALQGKSKSAAIWSYSALWASNGQLEEWERDGMRVPSGGIRAGLCGQVVRLTANG